jgi:hypothetical protein
MSKNSNPHHRRIMNQASFNWALAAITVSAALLSFSCAALAKDSPALTNARNGTFYQGQQGQAAQALQVTAGQSFSTVSVPAVPAPTPVSTSTGTAGGYSASPSTGTVSVSTTTTGGYDVTPSSGTATNSH